MARLSRSRRSTKTRPRRGVKTRPSRGGPNPIDIHVGAGRVRRFGSPAANIIKRAALTSALLIGLAGTAWADYQSGLMAYYRGDYVVAVREWQPLAQQGDAAAQFSLGYMHYAGQGVAQDYSEGLKWYRKAAEQGDADARYNV